MYTVRSNRSIGLAGVVASALLVIALSSAIVFCCVEGRLDVVALLVFFDLASIYKLYRYCKLLTLKR